MLDTELAEVDNVIRTMEMKVFGKFCREIGVENIREYETSTLKALQSNAEKKLEYSIAKSKIENM